MASLRPLCPQRWTVTEVRATASGPGTGGLTDGVKRFPNSGGRYELSPSTALDNMEFYAVVSLTEPPVQLFSKSHDSCFHCQFPLPLPKNLVVFGLGSWVLSTEETYLSVEVSVSPEIEAQKIGSLSPDTRCLVWEGNWRRDILSTGVEEGERGSVWTLLITSDQGRQVGFSSSTPVLAARRPAAPDAALVQLVDDILPLHLSPDPSSCPGSPLTPRAWQEPAQNTLPMALLPASQESNHNRSPQASGLARARPVHPSARWGHTLCVIDPNSVILIGGSGPGQLCCQDAVWKLEINDDDDDHFWFPLAGDASLFPNARGHSATHDPDTHRIYVFGGKNNGDQCNRVYILDTLTWKWSHVTGQGRVPSLAYHSAVVFGGELVVFGGLVGQPGGQHSCSNALFIFNPKHHIWYQPIVGGQRPSARCGHTATLLGKSLLLFGGWNGRVCLNDLYQLDLGLMEFSQLTVSGAPTPRCWHVALAVTRSSVLISGGWNPTGGQQDLYTFNIDTCCWRRVWAEDLCLVPRAGHSAVRLPPSHSRPHSLLLLLFGGSDSDGAFYNDTVRVTLELLDI